MRAAVASSSHSTRENISRVFPCSRRASSERGRRNVRARASGASDESAYMNRMRVEYARLSANPGAQAVVDALCELAEQEHGLSGVKFAEVMAKVDECFDFAPTAYRSGVGTPRETSNPAGTNNGSCKTFYFAKMCGLSERAAVRLFCEHYEDVVATPDGDSHANIRAFQLNGYAGLEFAGEALVAKGANSRANDV